MNKKAKNFTERDTNNKKEKKSKNVYYTVHLNDIYNPYDDKTVSENDMIKEIKRETSLQNFKIYSAFTKRCNAEFF